MNGIGVADPPNIDVAHEKIGQLVTEISDTAGAMIAQLNAAIAMAAAGDTVGLVYALRRSRAYWLAIAGSAADLVAADAERLSVLRQEGDE